MRLKLPFLIGAVLLLVTLEVCIAHDRAGFGEACDGASVKCNRRAHLNCSPTSFKCNCTLPESMVYEPDASPPHCSVKAGEQCKFQRGLDDDSSPIYMTYPCIENSFCSPDGYCTCTTGFFESSDGTCYPGRDFGDSCDLNSKCLDTEALTCLNGTCVCDPETSALSSHLGSCTGLLGKPCVNQQCITGLCGPDGLCTCDSEYFVQDSTTCSPKSGYSGACTSDDQCGQDEFSRADLLCLNGMCSCNPATSVYGVATEQHYGYQLNRRIFCAPLPNQRCFERYCSHGAICTDTRAYYYGYYDYSEQFSLCQCNSPNTASPTTGRCTAPYGKTCSADLPCYDGFACNPITGTCDCPAGQQYELQRCVNNALESCTNSTDCVSNSGCTNGTCTCDPGFLPASDGKCAAEVGGFCSSNADCDQIKNQLECRSNTCACRPPLKLSPTTGICSLPFKTVCDGSTPCGDTFACKQGACRCPFKLQVYSSEIARCVFKVGGPCNTTTGDAEPSCVSRAFCAVDEAGGAGLCKCSEDTVVTKDRLCAQVEGAGCLADADCDPKAGLECMDGKCRCPSHAIYSRQLRKCLGLVGAACTPRMDAGEEADYSDGTSTSDCVRTASCKNHPSGLFFECACGNGYGMTKDYTCG